MGNRGAAVAVVLALAPGVAASAAGPPAPVDPDYPINFLEGAPLDDPIGLTFVANGSVIRFGDSGVETEVLDGVTADSVQWTRRAGRRALVDLSECDGCATLLIDPARPEAAPIPLPAAGVAVGIDRLWGRQSDGDTCRLLSLAPDSGDIVDAQPIRCGWVPQDEVEAGLVVWDEATDSRLVVDPDGLAPLHELPGWFVVDTVTGPLSIEDRDAVLLDPDTFSVTERYAAPTATSRPLIRAVSPDGTRAAISYDSPAWPGPRQRLDIWLLDVVAGTWTRVPGMPLAMALKSLGVAFADDGRLVMAGHFEGTGPAIVVWDGAAPDVGVRPVDIAGVGEFAVFSSSALG